MRMREKKRNRNGLSRRLGIRIVLTAVCAAGFVSGPFGAFPVRAESGSGWNDSVQEAAAEAEGQNVQGAGSGQGVRMAEAAQRTQAETETEQNMQSARMDTAGMALWEAAQERQRALSQAEARLEGSWSLEYGGFRISQPFTGQAELTGLGTEELEGFLSITSSQETVFRFQNGQVTREDASGETVLLSDPVFWLAFSNGFMNGTTYDLSLVKELWVSGHEEDREDKSTVLSYRLEEDGAAKQIQPMVRSWLSGMGLSLPEEGNWLELHQVEGELTVSSDGYMAVDRLRAEASILMGQESAKGVFEICVTYPEAGG